MRFCVCWAHTTATATAAAGNGHFSFCVARNGTCIRCTKWNVSNSGVLANERKKSFKTTAKKMNIYYNYNAVIFSLFVVVFSPLPHLFSIIFLYILLQFFDVVGSRRKSILIFISYVFCCIISTLCLRLLLAILFIQIVFFSPSQYKVKTKIALTVPFAACFIIIYGLYFFSFYIHLLLFRYFSFSCVVFIASVSLYLTLTGWLVCVFVEHVVSY